MGLFSFSNKNKHESAAEESAFYASADDQAGTARARSKRASSAGEGAGPKRGREGRGAPDPILPEKKRARRRLVGAVALALLVAIGLPMVLDSEPKPLAADIAIQIPSKDRLALTSALSPSAVKSAELKAAASERAAPPEPVIELPLKPAPSAAVAPATALAPQMSQSLSAPPAEQARPSARAAAQAEPRQDEASHDKDKAAVRTAPRNDEKVAAKAAPKAEDKPAARATAPDEARALAILEGKPVDKTDTAAASARFMVRVAALATPDKISELQGKLKDAGFKSSTQKVPTQSGERTRVNVGPFSKEEAEKAVAKLHKLGLNGTLVQT